MYIALLHMSKVMKSVQEIRPLVKYLVLGGEAIATQCGNVFTVASFNFFSLAFSYNFLWRVLWFWKEQNCTMAINNKTQKNDAVISNNSTGATKWIFQSIERSAVGSSEVEILRIICEDDVHFLVSKICGGNFNFNFNFKVYWSASK